MTLKSRLGSGMVQKISSFWKQKLLVNMGHLLTKRLQGTKANSSLVQKCHFNLKKNFSIGVDNIQSSTNSLKN